MADYIQSKITEKEMQMATKYVKNVYLNNDQL